MYFKLLLKLNVSGHQRERQRGISKGTSPYFPIFLFYYFVLAHTQQQQVQQVPSKTCQLIVRGGGRGEGDGNAIGLASEHTTSKHSCNRALSSNAREILSRAHEVSMLKKKVPKRSRTQQRNEVNGGVWERVSVRVRVERKVGVASIYSFASKKRGRGDRGLLPGLMRIFDAG